MKILQKMFITTGATSIVCLIIFVIGFLIDLATGGLSSNDMEWWRNCLCFILLVIGIILAIATVASAIEATSRLGKPKGES